MYVVAIDSTALRDRSGPLKISSEKKTGSLLPATKLYIFHLLPLTLLVVLCTCNNNTHQQTLTHLCTMYVVLLYYRYVVLLYDHVCSSNIMHRLFYDAALCSSIY